MCVLKERSLKDLYLSLKENSFNILTCKTRGKLAKGHGLPYSLNMDASFKKYKNSVAREMFGESSF